jgi:hypothetical protein
MADASHDRDLLNAAAAFMAAAARRTPGPLNAEVKLAVERIAKEIKAIRAEVGGDNSLQGRVEALEAALADIAFNEKLLANGLAKSTSQTPPFSVTLTLAGMPGGSTVTWTVDGKSTTGASVSTYIGAQVSWSVSCTGYRTKTGTVSALSTQTINVTLEELQAVDIVLSGDFSDPHNQLTSLVDGSNFQISGTSIQNGSTSYNKDSGTSYGYIQLTTKESTTLSITASVGSESNYDFGGVYVGTKIYKPTQSQAKSKTTDGSGSYLMSISGSVSSKAYTMTLQANSTYYLSFFYVKDGSGNSNGDRFNVTEIKYRAVV